MPTNETTRQFIVTVTAYGMEDAAHQLMLGIKADGWNVVSVTEMPAVTQPADPFDFVPEAGQVYR